MGWPLPIPPALQAGEDRLAPKRPSSPRHLSVSTDLGYCSFPQTPVAKKSVEFQLSEPFSSCAQNNLCPHTSSSGPNTGPLNLYFVLARVHTFSGRFSSPTMGSWDQAQLGFL